MNACQTNAAEDRLNEAIGQLMQHHGGSTPPDYAVRLTLEALRKAGGASRGSRRRFIWNGIRYGAIAAMAAGLLASGVWRALPLGDASTAFADVVENVAQAQSVRFRARQLQGNRDVVVSRVAIRGDSYRTEVSSLAVQVVDFRTRRAAAWSVTAKRGWIWDIPPDESRHLRGQFADPITAFRSLSDVPDEKRRSDRFAGRMVDVFRIDDFPLFGLSIVERSEAPGAKGRSEVWVDRESHLPVKIVMTATFPGTGGEPSDPVQFILDEFQWNAPLDDDLFRIEVPEGFAVVHGDP